jgi:hypothetical protein
MMGVSIMVVVAWSVHLWGTLGAFNKRFRKAGEWFLPWPNGKACFNKCKQLFEYQLLLLL